VLLVQSSTTIKEVKLRIIAKEFGESTTISTDCIRLIHGACMLNRDHDQRTLKDCGITANATISSLSHLRGGEQKHAEATDERDDDSD